MEPLSPDWPQSATALLELAKQGVNLVQLITAGTHHIDSWLIENRVLPLLQTKKLGWLQFTADGPAGKKRTASLVPLPDGSAFACTTEGLWLALEAQDALHEIEHIGSRFAPGDHWLQGFEAHVQWGDDTPAEIRPSEAAGIWQQVTGVQAAGFESGARDQMEAYGFGIIDRMLHIHNRLGL